MAATGTPTPNIGLRRPVGTDPASVDDINYNSGVIDTKLGAVGSTSVQAQIDALNSKTAKKLSMTTPSTADVFNVALDRITDFVIGIHVKNANGDWLDNNYTTASDGKPIITVLHSGFMRLNFADYVSKDMEILYIHM